MEIVLNTIFIIWFAFISYCIGYNYGMCYARWNVFNMPRHDKKYLLDEMKELKKVKEENKNGNC